jgi:U2-associated protein SR140
MVRGLSGRRGELARCMAFSLEHAEAAGEVADIIVASLLVEGTPVPRKVARLYLICDILHNSAIPLPGAWRFRQEFQSRLGLVFDHLSGIYHSFPGRITADTFKKQITAVVDIWEDWIVFPPEFTAELRTRLEGQPSAADTKQLVEAATVDAQADVAVQEAPRFKSSSFKPATDEAVSARADGDEVPINDDEIDDAPVGDEIDGSPVDDLDGAPIEDVDGAPFDDVDGAPLDDIDGAPVDIDGEPLNDDDVDGAPMDEDVDGTPADV